MPRNHQTAAIRSYDSTWSLASIPRHTSSSVSSSACGGNEQRISMLKGTWQSECAFPHTPHLHKLLQLCGIHVPRVSLSLTTLLDCWRYGYNVSRTVLVHLVLDPVGPNPLLSPGLRLYYRAACYAIVALLLYVACLSFLCCSLLLCASVLLPLAAFLLLDMLHFASVCCPAFL